MSLPDSASSSPPPLQGPLLPETQGEAAEKASLVPVPGRGWGIHQAPGLALCSLQGEPVSAGGRRGGWGQAPPLRRAFLLYPFKEGTARPSREGGATVPGTQH